MGKKIRFLSSAFILLGSCVKCIINENYAANLARKKMSLSGPVTTKILQGGYSNAKIFLVTNDSKKYVVRFIKHASNDIKKKKYTV